MSNNKQRAEMIRGALAPVVGAAFNITGKEKQFTAILQDAGVGAAAEIDILFTPDGTVEKGVVIATLTLSDVAPTDFTEVLECLVPQYVARVNSVSGGAVWVYGDA